jgi:hypothetical protein
MPSNQVVTARNVLRAVLKAHRLGSRAAIEAQDAQQPDLTEFPLERNNSALTLPPAG